MVVGVIIPDRRDRKSLLNHCLFMIGGQTRQPDFIELVNFNPTNEKTDLTKRIRLGFESLKLKGCDCVLIMENDDFYSSNYIAMMLFSWQQIGKPLIFGTDHTYYYHIFKKEYSLLKHSGRASLMNTLISCKAFINWPNDNEVFLDTFLWKQLKGKTFSPTKPISIGIKHGIGLCGGSGHDKMRFQFKDKDFDFLQQHTDIESFNFYKSL